MASTDGETYPDRLEQRLFLKGWDARQSDGGTVGKWAISPGCR
jgi:hypothetical protein